MEELEDSRVRLSVEVEESELDPAIDEAFKQISKQVRIPGFRKGKVPRRVLESHFGKGVARGQALEDAIPEFFLSAIAEHEVDIIAPPDYDVTAGADEGKLAFDAVVQIRPTINIGGYESLRIEIQKPVPSDEEVDHQIDLIRGQFSQLEPVERAAQTGDHVTIDIAGSYEDEEVEGLTATDYVYELGSGAVVPEIDENLDGASVGDTLEFAADHPDPDEEGQLQFTLNVKEVQEKVLPELTDEFVNEATEFETVDAFRSDVVERLTLSKKQQANNELNQKISEAISKLVEIDAPDALIASEVNNRLQDMAMRMQQSGMDFAQYLQLTGGDIDGLRQQMREPAVESVKVDLALRAVAAAEGLNPTDAELDEELASLIGPDNDLDEVRERFKAANQMLAIRSDLGKRKAVDWLLERVEIIDEDGATIDRADLEMPEDDHDHDHDHSHDDAHEHDDAQENGEEE